MLFFNIHEEAIVKSIARRIRDLHTSIRHLRSSRTATNFNSTAPIQAHGVARRQLKNRDAVLDPAISLLTCHGVVETVSELRFFLRPLC